MLKVNNFLSEYEYIPNPSEITDEELQEVIIFQYNRVHEFQNTSIVFKSDDIDWESYETIMGLITGCYNWDFSFALDSKLMVMEYGSELLRRKIRDLIFKAY